MKVENKKLIFEKVQKFVERACMRNDKGYAKEWLAHLSLVSTKAVQLAEKLNANKEIVFLAAWFHDIGTITYGKRDHHITGAEIAEKKLKKLNYPQNKIEQIKHCIFSHRASQNIKRETIEAQILADADSMAHFDNVKGLFEAELVFNNISKDSNLAKDKVKQKLIRSWSKLSPEAKDFVKDKHINLMNLIQ